MSYLKINPNLKLYYHLNIPRKRLFPQPIFLLHGYSGHTQEPNLASLARHLASHGFLVVRFDTRGYGQSSGPAFLHYRVSNYLQDLSLLIQHLSPKYFSKKTKIYLWGHSLGGLIATIYAATNPRQVGKVCLVSPVNFFPEVLNDKDRFQLWKHLGWFGLYSKTYGFSPLPYDFVLDSQSYNASLLAPKIIHPFMLILGSKDELVNPHFSLKIYDQIQPSLAHLVTIDNLSHYYKKYPNQIQAVNYHTLRFFKSNI